MTPEALTAKDRCDHGDCPAAALVVASGGHGRFLLLCGHHSNKLEVALLRAGFIIKRQK